MTSGTDLQRWFGQLPSFHDAEIISLHLRRKEQSVLRLLGWINTGEVGQDGSFVLDRQAIETFTICGVVDLRLDGLGVQNVIGGLVLYRAPERSEADKGLA